MNSLSQESFDSTWVDVEPAIWSTIEVAVAFLGACAITYRPLLKWISVNWISKIQSVFSGRTLRRGSIKSSNGNAEAEVRLNNRPDFKHPLSVSLPSVPASTYNPVSRRGSTSSC